LYGDLLLLCPYFSVILYDRYRYILEAQTSLIQKRGEDTLTYLNKGALSSHIYIYFFNKQFVKKPRDSLGVNFSKLKSGGHVPLNLLSLFFFTGQFYFISFETQQISKLSRVKVSFFILLTFFASHHPRVKRSEGFLVSLD